MLGTQVSAVRLEILLGSSSHSQGVNASAALERLRTAAAARHVRLDELFADFDRLRTGLVTRPQLERCASLPLASLFYTLVFSLEFQCSDACLHSRLVGFVGSCVRVAQVHLHRNQRDS